MAEHGIVDHAPGKVAPRIQLDYETFMLQCFAIEHIVESRCLSQGEGRRDSAQALC
jgi:hypothetical protein